MRTGKLSPRYDPVIATTWALKFGHDGAIGAVHPSDYFLYLQIHGEIHQSQVNNYPKLLSSIWKCCKIAEGCGVTDKSLGQGPGHEANERLDLYKVLQDQANGTINDCMFPALLPIRIKPIFFKVGLTSDVNDADSNIFRNSDNDRMQTLVNPDGSHGTLMHGDVIYPKQVVRLNSRLAAPLQMQRKRICLRFTLPY